MHRRLTTPLRAACGGLAAVVVLAGCGDDDQSTGTDPAPDTTTAPPATTAGGDALLTSGSTPRRDAERQAIELETCAIDGDRAVVVAEVTNTGDDAQLLQGVPVTVQIDGSTVVDPADGGELWNSVTIGPGRTALVQDEFDLDGLRSGEATCILGEPVLHAESRDDAGEQLPADTIRLTGCASTDAVEVDNPVDEPIGVEVIVEFFDKAGYSVGQLELGQTPTTYTDGRSPGGNEVALEPGATGSYPITIERRIEDWETPHDGPVTSCEVVSATYVENPEPGEVIVD